RRMKLEDTMKQIWENTLPDDGTRERIKKRVLETAEAEKQTGSGTVLRRRLSRNAVRIAAAAASVLLVLGTVGVTVLLTRGRNAVRYLADTGEVLLFPKAELTSASLHLPYAATSRSLTDEECAKLVSGAVWRGGQEGPIANDDLVWRYPAQSSDGSPVIDDGRNGNEVGYILLADGDDEAARNGTGTAAAGIDSLSLRGTFRESTGELVRAEGSLGGVKLLFAAPGLPLSDTVLAGDESRSTLDGVPVGLGSFVTGANSRGEKTLILYAQFSAGSWKVQAEVSGDPDDPDRAAAQLVNAIRAVLAASSETAE
ncbi:MAG: hypothetical protein J6Q17_08210, partial [Clostridia bacterium]|nr:hypothetical protein [Clostridia bacterium]